MNQLDQLESHLSDISNIITDMLDYLPGGTGTAFLRSHLSGMDRLTDRLSADVALLRRMEDDSDD